MSSTYQTEAIAKGVAALFPWSNRTNGQRGKSVKSHFEYASAHLTRPLTAASNEPPSGLVDSI
jgi:hypothetical protein